MTKKPRTKTVPLEFPIEWDGKTISEVTLHRPKGKDMRRIAEAENSSSNKMEAGAVMVATLSDLPDGAIDELDFEDFTAISEAIADFFPKSAGQAVGVPSSPTARPN